VPPAVAQELEQPGPRFVPVLMMNYRYLRVQAPSDAQRVAELGLSLDPGESEAIALAEELGADELLIDEMAGRLQAIHSGLKTVGVLGVLISGKKAGMIPLVRPLLDRLRAELGFHIKQKLYDDVLRLADE